MDWLTSFLLVFAAEIGDKSQLVCMALAVRYRALPVLAGSILAFLLLNSIAVIFGSAIAGWIPELAIAVIVSLLFLGFGLHALLANGDDEEITDEDLQIKSQKHILFSTFALITLAELGDKTQLAVVALSSQGDSLSVWFGSTLALVTTSVMAVWAGRTILQRFPIVILHRFSGVLFIILGLLAAYSSFNLWSVAAEY
ncbi:MAG: TMEM165/GDT1 family protein [Oleispira sp.]|nr:TMEM165/GDT1 family protein [Oleispira sp.]MBL4882447.1 TMEM165/GDT1 family protein [Oleispira sp.]